MRWVSAMMALGVATCAAACAQDAPSAPSSSDPPGNDVAREVERPSIVDVDVVWPAESIDTVALAALSEQARGVIATSPVPAFVVAEGALLASAVVMAKSRWYAVSARADGVVVSLHASRAAHRYPHLPRAEGKQSVRGLPAFVTQNEQIWSAAWIEGGVAYSLELECVSLPDARCADDAHLMSLAARLAYVGGRPQ
jgi:hypothetical protein